MTNLKWAVVGVACVVGILIMWSAFVGLRYPETIVIVVPDSYSGVITIRDSELADSAFTETMTVPVDDEGRGFVWSLDVFGQWHVPKMRTRNGVDIPLVSRNDIASYKASSRIGVSGERGSSTDDPAGYKKYYVGSYSQVKKMLDDRDSFN